MWFTVDILMKSYFLDSGETELWEECFYLIEAKNLEEVECIAKEIANGEECEYLTESGKKIKWEFDSILKFCEIFDGKIGNRTELFSRFLRKQEAESLKIPF